MITAHVSDFIDVINLTNKSQHWFVEQLERWDNENSDLRRMHEEYAFGAGSLGGEGDILKHGTVFYLGLRQSGPLPRVTGEIADRVLREATTANMEATYAFLPEQIRGWVDVYAAPRGAMPYARDIKLLTYRALTAARR